MKHLKRILSISLAMILLFTGIELPMGSSAAMAEGVSSSGSSSVPATPDNLLSAGEWQYWVEDGVAYIAGYNNRTESTLKVPGSLGGYSVIGIGQMAFQKNKSLTSIQIHTNVTHIADDAFEGIDNLTIKAYNGSYALNYASNHHYKKNNLSSAAVFVETVVDLTGLSSAKAYSSLSDSGATFVAKEATFLKNGQILYFPSSSSYPTGLAKIVSGISIDNGVAYVSFSQPQWGDVFIEVSGSDQLILDWKNMRVNEGFELESFTSSSSVSSSANFSATLKADDWTLTGSIKVEAKAPSIDYRIGWQWWGVLRIPNVEYVEAKIPLTVTPSITLKYKDDDNDRLVNRKQFLGHKIEQKRKTLGEVPVASVGGVINGYMAVDLLCEVSGSLEISCTVEATLITTLQNGKVTRRIEKNFSNSKIEIKGNFKWGPEFKMYFIIGWAGFSIRFFELTAGIYAKITASIAEESTTGSLNTIYHGEVGISIEATLEGKIGLVKLAGWDIDLSFKITGTLGPFQVAKFHLDFAEKFYASANLLGKSASSCVMKDRSVVFENDGNLVLTTTYDVNKRMSQPTDPIKSGYKFVGWYVNTSKSGLTGSDYLFNFDKNPMPYLNGMKTLYLYAKWSQLAAAVTPTPVPTTSFVTPTPTPTPKPGDPTTPAPVTPTPTPTPTAMPATVHVSRIDLNPTYVEQTIGSTSSTGTITAQVFPSDADNTSVTWESSDPSVVSVNDSGVYQIKKAGMATIICRSVSDPAIMATCIFEISQQTPTPPPATVHVTSIALNKTSIEQYNDDSDDMIVLTAQVYPSNADNISVRWESSNRSVAYVNEYGEVSFGKAGTATITCRSVSDPSVTATCAVTVKQHIQEIYIDGDTDSLIPGETVQLTVDCYPSSANNKAVTWSSSNKNIATVNTNGKVTAVGYGDAVITAKAKDGSNVSATYIIHVEHELALEVSIVNGTAYQQGDSDLLIAYISPTTGSMRRMAQDGYDLQWSVSRKSGTASAQLNKIETTFTDGGTTYDSSIASLIGTELSSAGTSTFTVTCNAGPYSATANVSITVDGTAYAEKVKLNPSTFYLDIGGTATIPSQPSSTDSKPVPSGLSMRIDGDRYYSSHATETEVSNGISVSFNESGVFTASVKYYKGNKSYEVPVTFYVQDENGVIHLRVENIELNQSYIQLVQGKTSKLTAIVTPNDAYNKTVKWSSSDPTIATVSSKGVVTAKKPGAAAIYCEATDGSGVSAMCAVIVEAYLQLDEDVVDYTIYSSGNDHADLGIINITYASQQRLLEDGLNVTWTLTRNSGNATEVALEEFRNSAENGVSVSGNKVKLIRINGTGDDTYTLTCRAGDYSDQCLIHVHVLGTALPNSVGLTQSTYTGKINEYISVDLTPVCSPSSAELPSATSVAIEGNRVFMDALSSMYTVSEPGELIFEKAGTYQTNVVFSGDNYSYECPIIVTVKDESGTVPKNITDITIEPEYLTMLVGESASLTATVLPADATYSKLTWSSSDTSVTSVSTNGIVTAIGSGMTTILVTAPETDVVSGIMVVVEDGLTLETDELIRTVFVDGTTRMQLDTLMLTEASSSRQASAPEWSLTRVSGNNLTLRAEPYQTTNSSGQMLYGCSIVLYSVSRTGDTTYELTCTNGAETATASIIVHAVEKDAVLPAGIDMQENTFTGDINELIVIEPNYVCYPASASVPNGMKISLNGDRQFTAAVNTRDFFVSQSKSTLSFNKTGTYHANYVMEYANVRYVIPLVFRVRDGSGQVPVQASEIKLNHANLNLVANEIAQLETVFTPVDTTNQNVTWRSSDSTVATVDATGKVKAISNGTATITCTPEDAELLPVACAVTVEDYLTVIPGSTSMVLYIQGDQVNVTATAMLSVGTIERLENAGLTPEWDVNMNQVTHAQLVAEAVFDASAINVSSSALLSAGTDTYVIKCTAGNYMWQQEYTLIVRSAGSNAPTAISMRTPTVNTSVNQSITIDFSPVMTPSNAQIPSNMHSTYVGLGDFYEARDEASYSAEGDTVTVKFTRAGQYILTRRYRLGNVQFVVPCVIKVGNSPSGFNLLSATETDFTVYSGGQSGSVSTVSLSDHMVETLWGDSIKWSVQRVSGNSLNVALKNNGSSVDVFVANAEKNGTDVWRVTAEFGGLSDSVDIRLTAAQPRGALPDSLVIADDTISGVIGTWINVPLSFACVPSGTMLPDQGDDFWSVDMDAHGTDRSVIRIENGMARFSFVESGYYTAELKYKSGNVSYTVPVYFVIRDEEDVVSKPALQLFLINANSVVYPEGEVNVPIAQAVVSETLSVSNIGASLAYMNNQDAVWSVKINSGTAATLNLVRSSANTYDLVLASIKAPGNITYTVSCKVDGITYSGDGSLHVASSTEERPDPTLLRTSYQVVQGEQVVIDRNLYSKKDGSILQSSSTWNPASFLAAAGYEIKEEESNWMVTFYKTGTFTTTVDGYASNLKIQVPLSIQVIPAGGTVTMTVMKLPSALTEIEEEAFRGVTTNVIDLRGTKVKVIGSAAFMGCVDLLEVYLPSTVKTIADDAFYGCLNVTFHCPSGSYAESYAIAHGFNVIN